MNAIIARLHCKFGPWKSLVSQWWKSSSFSWITKSYLGVVVMSCLFFTHPFCLCKLTVNITSPPSFSYASVWFSLLSSSVFLPTPLSPCDFHTPSFLFLSSCLLLLYHLNSVIMQRYASFAAWNAAKHSGNLLAGWLIPVYLAPVEPAAITEPSVMDAVCRLKGQRMDSVQSAPEVSGYSATLRGWLSVRGETGIDSGCWGFQFNVLKVVVAFCVVFKTHELNP